MSKVPWKRVRTRELAKANKDNTTKNKNHAESLKRFRLTRFGCERRKAGLNARKKRRWASWKRKRAKTIEFVHRSDLRKLMRAVPYYKFRVRDFPRDPNPNLRPARALLPAHFG